MTGLIKRATARRVMVAGAAVVLWAAASGAEGQEAREQVPSEWETVYVVLLDRASPSEPVADSARAAIMDGHVQYQLRLQREGTAVAAGGFAPEGDDPLTGMTLLRAESPEEARAIMDADPAVAAGLYCVKVRTWWVPADRLQAPPNGPMIKG